MGEQLTSPDLAGPVARSARAPLGLRLLGWFWGVVLLAMVAGAVRLQMLGPVDAQHAGASPDPAGHVAATPAEAAAHAPAEHGPAHPAAEAHAAADAHPAETHGSDAHAGAASNAHSAPAVAADAAGHDAPVQAIAAVAHGDTPSHGSGSSGAQPVPDGAIRSPVPALLEPSAGDPSARLPRIAPDGRMPRQVYAGQVDPTERRPRVAILLGGIGQSESDTEEASRSLPAAISFVVSPYTMRPERLLDVVRSRGHEMLVGLPMEPLNYPVNDEGNAALLTVAPPEQNEQRLDWALSRIEGYVGATNALDGLRGERFSAATIPIGIVLRQLAARGLLYVDATPALSRPPRDLPPMPTRGIDMVLDDPAVRSEIDTKLAAIEQLARDRGSALGLAGLPRPVTLGRLAAWTAGLNARGVALVPVSAVITAPSAHVEAQARSVP